MSHWFGALLNSFCNFIGVLSILAILQELTKLKDGYCRRRRAPRSKFSHQDRSFRTSLAVSSRTDNRCLRQLMGASRARKPFDFQCLCEEWSG